MAQIWCCCGCGVGQPAAAALIWPLTWELPYATGVDLKKKAKKKKKEKKKKKRERKKPY